MSKWKIFLAFCVLCVFAGLVSAAWEYQYDVTDYATASEALTAYTTDWTSTYPTSGTPSLTVAEDSVSGSNALMFNNGDSGSTGYGTTTYNNAVEYGDQFVFEMKCRVANETVSSGSNQLMVYFSKNYGDDTYGAVWFQIRNTGITAYNSSGGWTSWYGSLGYTWHTITVEADFEDKTYAFFIDGAETSVLSVAMNSLDLTMKIGDGSGSIMGQTNVEYVQWGAVPEPMTALLLMAGISVGLLKRKRK